MAPYCYHCGFDLFHVIASELELSDVAFCSCCGLRQKTELLITAAAHNADVSSITGSPVSPVVVGKGGDDYHTYLRDSVQRPPKIPKPNFGTPGSFKTALSQQSTSKLTENISSSNKCSIQGSNKGSSRPATATSSGTGEKSSSGPGGFLRMEDTASVGGSSAISVESSVQIKGPGVDYSGKNDNILKDANIADNTNDSGNDSSNNTNDNKNNVASAGRSGSKSYHGIGNGNMAIGRPPTPLDFASRVRASTASKPLPATPTASPTTPHRTSDRDHRGRRMTSPNLPSPSTPRMVTLRIVNPDKGASPESSKSTGSPVSLRKPPHEFITVTVSYKPNKGSDESATATLKVKGAYSVKQLKEEIKEATGWGVDEQVVTYENTRLDGGDLTLAKVEVAEGGVFTMKRKEEKSKKR